MNKRLMFSAALVMTGELDYRVPYTQSLQYFTALQTLNIPSRLIVLKYDGLDAALLQRAPRLVPSLSRRCSCTLGYREDGE